MVLLCVHIPQQHEPRGLQLGGDIFFQLPRARAKFARIEQCLGLEKPQLGFQELIICFGGADELERFGPIAQIKLT